MTSFFDDFEVISMYTREEAILDGELVDVSETAKEAGLKFPVAVTRRVWNEVVSPDEKAIERGESEKGRLWDVLNMFRIAAIRSNGQSLVNFKVIATVDGKEHYHLLQAIIGPGDNGEPVLTVMFPGED